MRAHYESFERGVWLLKAARRGFTVRQASEKFERSGRTVKRDIEALRLFLRAPIEFNRARQVYELADPNWRLGI